MSEAQHNEDTAVQLGIIIQRLGSIEQSLAEMKPMVVKLAVIENRVKALEMAPNHAEQIHEHEPMLSNHCARLENIESDVKSLFDRSWQIIAGIIMLVVGAVIAKLKGDF